MKYYWFEFKNYTSLENLWKYVEDVLSNYSKKYVINFG